MKPLKIFATTALLLLSLFTKAQDTTFVQTLTFDSINSRSGIWNFPDDGTSFRKILMYYTLKCDPATTQDSYDCGEWDYSTTNILREHTGIFDSVRVEHPRYLFGGQNLDTIQLVNSPYFDFYQSYQYNLNIFSTVSEQDYLIGSGNIQNNNLFGSSVASVTTQILWTVDELNDAGLQAGSIDKLRFSLTSLGSDLNHLSVSMKYSNLDSLITFDNGDFQQVYHSNTSFSSVGTQTLDLYNPFEWDGTSNILMEISFLNDIDNPSFVATNNVVESSDAGIKKTAFASGRDGYLQITSGEQIDVALNNVDFGQEVTVSFWAQGNAEVLPLNTSVFEGFNENNSRRINCHLPWGNNNLYWDAGDNSGGASRIYKPVTIEEISGQWTHWAFTKDAQAGTMYIYRNGEIWHSGVEKFDPISVVNTFRIASRSLWDGKLDEFRVWKKSLSQENITDWMTVPLDNSHPLYDDLVLYYDFNDQAAILDKSPNGFDGAATNENMIKFHNSSEHFTNIETTTNRPNITFVQGEYTSVLDSTLVLDSVLVNPITLAQYEELGSYFNILSIEHKYPQSWSYIYNPNGEAIDSTFYESESTIYNDTIHYYQEPFELINRYELGRFITPYGLGLDLGDGFRWVYDVTDFAHLLKGEVDINSPNRSELVDLRFALIHGTPARPVKKISHVWDLSSSGSVWGGYSYRNLDDDVSLQNKEISLLNDTEYIKLKTIITGHGHNSSNGAYPHCCEWKDNTHYLYANGNQIADWHIWQTNDCALNPVFPQGGTWPGAREGWCPGDVVKGREFELSQYIENNTISIDYDITPVPTNNSGMGSGRYDITMDLVEYGEANFELDVEIYDVVSPNNWEYVSRKNPICNGVQFVLRNGGTQTLNSASISYQVSGGQLKTYEWTGQLKFMESEIVTINIDDPIFWQGDGAGIFTITANNPNNSQDEYEQNNTFVTKYDDPTVFENQIALRYKANNLPQGNSVTVTDFNGNVVYSNENLSANAVYHDTLELENGCYNVKVLDLGNNGLSYWAYPDQGNGFFQVRPMTGPVINFGTDFGREINFSFVIGGYTNIGQHANPLEVFIFPNPSYDIVHIESNQIFNKLVLYDLSGRILINKDINDFNSTINLKDFANGVYFMDIISEHNRIRKKVIKK